MVGLGKMGGNMAPRIRADGHDVVGFDPRGVGSSRLCRRLEQASLK